MQRKLYFILTIVIISFDCLTVFSQEPAFFVIGEKELVNTDVYSIIQTDNKLLYIATNNGLLVYKHGQFQQIPRAKEQHGNSLFDLQLDKHGDLFCGNLSGQIFKMANDRLELFFDLGMKNSNRSLLYSFDENNHLIIASSNNCLDVFKGKTKNIFSVDTGIYSLKRLVDGRIIIGTSVVDTVISLKNGVLDKTIVARGEYRKDFVRYRNNTLLVDNNFLNIYESGAVQCLRADAFPINVSSVKNERYFQYKKNEIWALDHSNGLRKISLNNNVLIASDRYYEEQFISAMTAGRNGIFFLGTFGSGIMVVPNESIQRHIIEGNDAKIVGITTDENNNVFLSTRDGKVIRYNGHTEIIEYSPGASLNHIFYAEGLDFGVNKKEPSIVYDGKPWDGSDYSFGSVKDIYKVDRTSAFIATSNGVFKVGDEMNGQVWTGIYPPNIYYLSILGQRCKSVAYSKSNQLLYVATMFGVKEISAKKIQKEILYNNKSVICKDLMFYQNELWCATSEYGILIFENGNFLKRIDQRNGLGNNNVNKIELHKNQVYISHKKGFQIFNLEHQSWMTLGTAEGIVNGSVHDFCLSKDKLWILSDGQPLSFSLNSLSRRKPIQTIEMDSIVVSNERLKNTNSNLFSYSQNQFSFYVNFNGIEYEAETTIKYRIKGFEKNWNSIASTTSLIEYKYLPPGKYVFEAKTYYRNQNSKTLFYSFVISPPYWQTWWFYIIVGTLLGVGVFSFYLYQIRQIDKRNQEKLEKQRIQTDMLDSELKALRSQMNPHFIFNSLNSIQALVLKEDTDSSYDYITLFAKLVRSTLNYSNREFIPIESELEFLEVYLSLEKLRFGEKFEYEIIFDDEKNVDVPSLLIQPFIENALHHGLMHRKGLKKLSIKFELGEKLKCVIIDNGIGRVKAKEINLRRNGEHESFALSAVEQRMSLLNKQLGEEAGSYTIEDLYEGDEATGTRVKLIIPFKSQY